MTTTPRDKGMQENGGTMRAEYIFKDTFMLFR